MSIKGQQIADYAKSKIGCPYVYGGYGQTICSPSFRQDRVRQYPEQMHNTYSNCPVLSGKQGTCQGCKWNGKQVYDCAQLTLYCARAAGLNLPSGATSQWNSNNWEKKGEIKDMPDVPGIILYHRYSKDPRSMSHTGVYVGNGMVVDARGAAHGVIYNTIGSYEWTHWGALPGVLEETDDPEAPDFEDEVDESVTEYALQKLYLGSKGNHVKLLQYLLNANGYKAGTVDGDFGNKTMIALTNFRKDRGLDKPGEPTVCDTAEWRALLG